KAIQVTRYGGPEVLALADVEIPEPGEGEVLLKLDYAGVNFIDVYTRKGDYAKSDTYANRPPFTIGREGAGTVVKSGENVDGLAEGDRVAYCLVLGSYAEYAVVPAWRLVRVPPDFELPVATTLMLQGCTAHYLSHSLFPLEPGHRCLVHAASGGVGQLLLQLAKVRGAEVFATVGSEEKAKMAKARGADHVILYREQDFAEVVLEITDGEGVDVVYDAVGKATIEGSMRCVKRRGTLVNFGGASGLVTSIEPLALAEAGSIFFTRPHMADYMRDASQIRRRAEDMFGYIKNGRLEVNIERVYPLSDAARAHEHMEAGKTTGKLLLDTAAH
ncbi:MAG: quinone oxidoreductase, partial [Gammaproteobacteria bacterium]|nr:quinone oxidoreductase [Gammaproteobacteria bacterium]